MRLKKVRGGVVSSGMSLEEVPFVVCKHGGRGSGSREVGSPIPDLAGEYGYGQDSGSPHTRNMIATTTITTIRRRDAQQSDPTKQTAAAQHLPTPPPARHTADSTTPPSRLRGPESAGYPLPPRRQGASQHRPSPGLMVPCLRRWRRWRAAASAAGGSTAAGHGADTTAEGRRTRPGSRDSRSGSGGFGRGRRRR